MRINRNKEDYCSVAQITLDILTVIKADLFTAEAATKHKY